MPSSTSRAQHPSKFPTSRIPVGLLIWGALVTAPGCRGYPGAGPFVAIPGFADSAPARASGTETRSELELPNGVRVVLEENHATPVIALQAWIDAGAAHDPESRPGLSFLVKDLVMRSPQLGELSGLGGRLSAWVSHDTAVYRAVIASPYLGRGLRLLADLLSRPAWPPPGSFAAARQSAVAAAHQATATPERQASQLAFRTAFRDGRYGRPVEGSPARLALASDAEVRDFHARFYVPTGTLLVVVGDFDSASVRRELVATFGGWSPPAGARTASPEVTTGDAHGPIVETGEVTQPELAIGFRTPAVQHGDTPALELLGAVIGRGGSGRLQTNVVRTREMATRAGAYLFEGRASGMLVASATLSPGRIDEAVGVIVDDVLRLGRERVAVPELERARVAVEGEDAADKSSLDGYAAKLGWFGALAGDASLERKYRARFHKVDAGDVQAVARKYLRASNMVIAVVIPEAPVPSGRGGERIAQLSARLQGIVDACERQVAVPPPSRRALTSASTVGRDFVDYRLPAGVRLLVVPDDTASQVAVRALWPGGSRIDDARLAGASALIARLLPLGTRSGGASSLDAELTSIAGTMEGIAGADVLGLRADFLASRWERGLELVADVLRNPRFSEEDVERERRVQLDLIRRRDDDPAAPALHAFREAVYGAHPYRAEVLGTLESVSAVTRRRLLDHFRRNYRTAGLTIAIVGAVDPAQVAAKVQSLFGDPSPSSPPATQVPETADGARRAMLPRRDAPLEILRSTPGPVGHVMLGYLGLAVADPDRYALDVIAQILNQSLDPAPGGRLWDALPRAAIGPGRIAILDYEAFDPGFFAVSVPVRPDAIETVVAGLRGELARMVEHGVNSDELERARQLLVGRSALAFERRGAVAMALSLHGAFGETIAGYRADSEALSRVTADDVLRVARRVLDPKGEVLVIVRPREPEGNRPAMNGLAR